MESLIKRAEVEKKDWTNGCIALSNKDIEKLYKLVLLETPIYIKK